MSPTPRTSTTIARRRVITSGLTITARTSRAPLTCTTTLVSPSFLILPHGPPALTKPNQPQTEKAEWKKVVDGLLGKILTDFFPQKMGGGKIFSEYLCEPSGLCNYNEILFKGVVSHWLTLVALIVPETYDKIFPKLQTSAQAAAQSCSGSGNNTCGIKWYTEKWDGTIGMEQQIIATDILGSVLVSEKRTPPLNTNTGGDSKSNPNAGTDDENSNPAELKPVTTGDRAGAGILTVLFVGAWGAMIAWMVLGEPLIG